MDGISIPTLKSPRLVLRRFFANDIVTYWHITKFGRTAAIGRKPERADIAGSPVGSTRS
jgi:hypothetical protein